MCRNIDINLRLDTDGTVSCRHCDTAVGSSQFPFDRTIQREQDSQAAGPGIHADPKHFTDSKVVLRQRFCPSCYTVLSTEIVPIGEDKVRGWKM